MELLEKVRHTVIQNRMLRVGDSIVVGVSGGPDSLCLLHVLGRLRAEFDLTLHVAHLNHCLRGAAADADAHFVANLAEEWGIPVHIESIDVRGLAKQRRLAVEEAARQARYAFLARTASQVGSQRIAVGHNADDQVETIIMHWLRGSGLAGLRGMLPVSRLQDLRLWGEDEGTPQEAAGLLLIRPLLDLSRSAIQEYCARHGLEPRFDLSNLDTTYYRNKLRHELLPYLETFNPRIREVILRSAAIIRADYACLRHQSRAAWHRITISESPQAIAFNLEQWRALPLALQRSVLREAIHRLRRSLRNINWIHVQNALDVLAGADTGVRVTLPKGLQARLDYDKVWVCEESYRAALPDLPLLQNGEVKLHIPGETPLPASNWWLIARILDGASLPKANLRHMDPWRAYLDYGVTGSDLSLRTRRRGDRFCPQGLGGKCTALTSFMTNAKIPHAWRDKIPLLVSSAQILWVAGSRIDERARVTDKTMQVLDVRFAKDANHEM